MCYSYDALDVKTQVPNDKFVRTIYILIGTMVRKWTSNCEKVLINSKFFEQRKAKQFEQGLFTKIIVYYFGNIYNTIFVEFDPGSGQTLAACFKHASRTEVRFSTEYIYMGYSVENLPLVADGWVTRE